MNRRAALGAALGTVLGALAVVVSIQACPARTSKQEVSVNPTPAILLECRSLSDSRQHALVDVRITNAGNAPVWLNGRMLVNTPHAPVDMRELWFEITDPSGADIPFMAKVRTGEASEGEYVRLLPGQTHSVQVDLSTYYQMLVPGTYTVTAHYQDSRSVAPPFPSGETAFRESIIAVPFHLTMP